MRIWSILLIKSDLKWCLHLSRSLFSYLIENGLQLKCDYQNSVTTEQNQTGTGASVRRAGQMQNQVIQRVGDIRCYVSTG